MDKAGLILWGFTVIMYFFPVVLIIFFIWLFFKIRANSFAKSLHNPQLSKSIKKKITQKRVVKISFFTTTGIMGLSAACVLVGVLLAGCGILWALFSVTINNGNFAKAFDPFADFVFNYWYAMIFVVAVGLAAAIIFLASGIYVSIVYRNKLKEI